MVSAADADVILILWMWRVSMGLVWQSGWMLLVGGLVHRWAKQRVEVERHHDG